LKLIVIQWLVSAFIRVHPGWNFVQKKIKKNVDARVAIWQIVLTHGNNRTTTLNKMRTKTLLLTAAALLAAGITTSQAQPVYSQNIVGYASIGTPSPGVNYLLTIPFAIGVSNGANEIWPLIAPGQPTLPDFSGLLTWNPNTGAYTSYTSDSAAPGLWDDQFGNQMSGSPVLPVGQGFFLSPSSAYTNVFAGTIAVNVGTSNVMNLPSAGINYLVGCVVPYAGAITNGNATTFAGGPNLSINGGLPDFSGLLIWNPNTGSYASYTSDSAAPGLWDDQFGNQMAAPPTINVGQGFFLSPANPFAWHVGL
jgi:hypothetical protein